MIQFDHAPFPHAHGCNFISRRCISSLAFGFLNDFSDLTWLEKSSTSWYKADGESVAIKGSSDNASM